MVRIPMLSTVALLEDLPLQSLRRGQVGTVVEDLGDDACEVEFSDDNGQTYASVALRPDQMMLLHHSPSRQAA